jgi:hypothetical protein
MPNLRLSTLIVVALALSAFAQEHQHSPYAGHEMSEIPSFTPTELEQLRNGDGMGLARPAELNHFPGPKHVLELAAELELRQEQRTRVEEVFAAMQQQARALGAEITPFGSAASAERASLRRLAEGKPDRSVLKERLPGAPALTVATAERIAAGRPASPN